MKPVNGLLTWEKALRGVRMAYNRMIGLVPVLGRLWFDCSRPRENTHILEAEGLPVEAVKWNPTTVILGVDESKLTYPMSKLTEP